MGVSGIGIGPLLKLCCELDLLTPVSNPDTFNFPGKPVAYMPYAEVKRIEQEAQVQNPATRSASPYRLSPREVNKASPQPEMNTARYSVPPGKELEGQIIL